MNKSKNRSSLQAAPVLVVAAMILAFSLGSATAQSGAQAQEYSPRAGGEVIYVTPQAVLATAAEGAQLPQDIRIMQRIVQTALGEVEAPELPDELRGDDPSSGEPGFVYSVGGAEAMFYLSRPGNRRYSIGSRDVTGFYMQGYGYLFTVQWRVAPSEIPFLSSNTAAERVYELSALASEARRAAASTEARRAAASTEARRAAASTEAAEARAAEDAGEALEQERERLEERQAAWDQWSAEYRDMLAEGLRYVVAHYGSTLNRATRDESITFIADFGGGEAETVTFSARRGELTGASREENLAAVQMAKGETGVSGILRTELKMMAEIIGSSLQGAESGTTWVYSGRVRYLGGESSYQYVPGYGVLFRNDARLNMATQVIRQVNPARLPSGVNVQSLRQQIDESTEEQRQAYVEHLAGLKEKTAEIFTTYGPTLTELNDDDWVGVFYDVGSAAGLLEGGITNFLVQARMRDIRQAGGDDAVGAAWLLENLVTNEKQD